LSRQRTNFSRATVDPRAVTEAKSILVTGASTGIGRKITEHLSANGCLVYAGARRARDLDSLAAMRNVRPIRLDVTSAQDIAAAYRRVMNDGIRLYGLVNNAGVATLGPIVDGREDEFDLVMAVNVVGVYRVTRAFAKSIMATRGRIVMIGSIAGILANGHVGAYSMSKHAIEAFTDSLAQELEPAGVGVSIIEPGNFGTDILKNAMQRIGSDAGSADRLAYPAPDAVAAAAMRALFDPRPKRRYLVVSTDDEMQRTLRKQIALLVELNQGHAGAYGRSRLVTMLDEELSRSGAPR
jgi:NAD(P)-dependent dehydrogenase (short-subunit alcohol dehydrogenase family)